MEKSDFIEKREKYYTSIFAQCFSPCGKFLAACSNFGYISIFSLSSALSPEANDESKKPFFRFPVVPKESLYCLVSMDQFLISGGGNGVITAWNWSDLLSKVNRIAWFLTLPSYVIGKFDNFEINSMLIFKQNANSVTLFAGCGDSFIHYWDLSNLTYLGKFEGHTDCIHSLASGKLETLIISGSEDGSVKYWDTRHPSAIVHSIIPSQDHRCSRPEFGKFIKCVAVDESDDWMVCGGGPNLSVWHTLSKTPTTVLDEKSKAYYNFVTYHEGTIISGGNENLVKHWGVNGDKLSQVPCTPTNIFNVCINKNNPNYKVLTAGGNTYKIDTFINFGYKAFSYLCS